MQKSIITKLVSVGIICSLSTLGWGINFKVLNGTDGKVKPLTYTNAKNMKVITDVNKGGTYTHAIDSAGLVQSPGLEAILGTDGDVVRQWCKNKGLGLTTEEKSGQTVYFVCTVIDPKKKCGSNGEWLKANIDHSYQFSCN